ncbi:STAS domain-containing protein [Streptomyces sp. HMX112]|uniref:STAS domain-containing protein n=1 Tax=Streptomyces sp. HMX112 TaxID=3390850 RepID=UPI003A7FC94D
MDPIVLTVTGPVSPADAPRLRAELAARLDGRARGGEVVCDVTGVVRPDLAVVDLLARLLLTARGAGHRLALRGTGRQLRALLELVGLTDQLRDVSPPAGPGGRTAGTSA